MVVENRAEPPHLHLSGMAQIDGPATGKVYGTPRVFDLFTLLAVTMAFALLVAMTNFGAPYLGTNGTGFSINAALFVTGIGLGQALLFSGAQPRLASILAGPPLMLLQVVAFVYFQSRQLDLTLLILIYLWLGVPAGYLAGAVVAGVFLVADALRSLPWFKSSQATGEAVGFEEVE